MFELNPLNLPDAQWQHLTMLIVAAVLGFVSSYVGRKNTARQLEDELAIIERDLDECNRRNPPIVTLQDLETSVLNRIRARTGQIDFAHIGRATADEADNLKNIIGIGPFLEKKLHAIGIYTYQQIANFSSEDIDAVTNAIEFFPGRIERDHWVSQASELAKKK